MDCEALHCGKTEIKKVPETNENLRFWELFFFFFLKNLWIGEASIGRKKKKKKLPKTQIFVRFGNFGAEDEI